jgi:protein-S-isoprenylcysteine O-methyltransferase Ste14
MTNRVVPKSIDSGLPAPLAEAIAVNCLLLSLFAVQHSVMARRGFKAWWTQIIPKPIERSTYVLCSSVLLIFLFWQWRPIPTVIWEVRGAVRSSVLLGICLSGWVLVLYTSFLIDHFDLFGLRQVVLHLRRREITAPPFVTPWLYRIVRHPLYLGWLLFFWVTPVMTAGHLLFAAATTAYIFAAVQLEERDLASAFGDVYRDYRERTAMIIPGLKPRSGAARRTPVRGVTSAKS